MDAQQLLEFVRENFPSLGQIRVDLTFGSKSSIWLNHAPFSDAYVMAMQISYLDDDSGEVLQFLLGLWPSPSEIMARLRKTAIFRGEQQRLGKWLRDHHIERWKRGK